MTLAVCLPAQAGIHRQAQEIFVWKEIAAIQKWIPACAGITTWITPA